MTPPPEFQLVLLGNASPQRDWSVGQNSLGQTNSLATVEADE